MGMSREEAIEVLQQDIPCEHDTDLIEALDMAIEALEQEPCGDAISRQAVLYEIYNTNGISNLQTTYLAEKIKTLSPVTPTEKVGHWEWVRYEGFIGNWHCSECRTIIPHMPEETDNTPIYKWCPMCGAKMQEVDEIGKEENPNKWIPVSERYPEDGQHILFSTKTGCVFEGRYSADTSAHNWLSYKDDTYAWNNVVTAWMPLPEPYKASPTGEEVEE